MLCATLLLHLLLLSVYYCYVLAAWTVCSLAVVIKAYLLTFFVTTARVEQHRTAQVYFMQMNGNMYHKATDTAISVRTFNLNDELGVISFVLSDKTGTLTDNVMQVRHCSTLHKKPACSDCLLLTVSQVDRSRSAVWSGANRDRACQSAAVVLCWSVY